MWRSLTVSGGARTLDGRGGSVAEKNDNQSAAVELLRQRISAHDSLQVRLETQKYLGATIAPGGQTWRSTGSASGASKRPGKDKDDLLSVPLDLVSDKVQQMYGRLGVRFYRGTFRTLEDERVGTESPEYAEKLDLLQDLHWRWIPRSNVGEWLDEMNFRRVVFGWDNGRWRLPTTAKLIDRHGALILDPALGPRLVVDPNRPNQDPSEHEYIISIEVMSLDEANAIYEPALKAKGRYPLEGGTRIGELIASDMALDRFIGRKVYGATDSNTPGVIIATSLDHYCETRDVFLWNPPFENKNRQKVESEWFHVWPNSGASNDWPYGCPWLKLDAYRNVRKWCGDSVVQKLAGQQAIANLMMRIDMQTAWGQAYVRILALSGALEEGGADKLRSNKQFEIVGLKRGYDAKNAVQVLQMPRYDAATDRMLRLAISATERTSGTSDALIGTPSPREPAAGYMERVRQALVPMEPTVESDRRRVEGWMKNGTEAAARFHGLTTPRKYCVMLFGEGHKDLLSGSGSVERVRKRLDSGPVKFVMPDESFTAQALPEIKQELMLALKAGRFNLGTKEGAREWAITWFARTGQEWEKGENDAYQEANRVIGQALRGEPVEVAYGDPVSWIVYLAKQYLGVSRSRHYSAAQRLALRRVISAAKDVMELEAAENAVIAQGLGEGPGASPGGPSGGSSAQASAPTAMAEPVGGSQMGELLAAEAG